MVATSSAAVLQSTMMEPLGRWNTVMAHPVRHVRRTGLSGAPLGIAVFGEIPDDQVMIW
jgi:hypothetical protein